MDYTSIKKLYESLALKNEFICVASHELKTPLTSLMLQVEMVKRFMDHHGADAISPVKVKSLINRTHQDVLRLSRLVDDMLDISRINSGKFTMNYEYFNLEEFMDDFLDKVAYSQIRKKINAPILVKWDKFRIEQVMLNLLNNAIRYGEDSQIDVEVSVGDNLAFITIRDYGPGIPMEMQKKIFERFERGDISKSEGLGLGLYISQEIIQHHKGKILLDSEIGKGAAFVLQIPLT